MASRILHGSRAPKHRPGEQEGGDRPTGLPRRAPSSSSAQAPSSKILSQPASIFSRGRTTKTEVKPAAATQPSATRTRAADGRPNPTVAPRSDSMQRSLSNIPRGMEPGMGSRTEVSAARPQRNRLRRKTSSQDPRGEYSRSDASKSSHDFVQSLPQSQSDAVSSQSGYADPYPNTVFGVTLPPATGSISTGATLAGPLTEFATSSSRMDAYVSRNPQRLSNQDLPPPPGINFPERSSTSSTRCSESPGPFSRTSTPTSASSFSPSSHQGSKFASRVRLASSPVSSRPPVTRRKVGPAVRPEHDAENQGLAAVRESITSSSSSSTVKGPEPAQQKPDSMRPARKQGLDAIAPTDPARLASRKLQKAPTADRQGRKAQDALPQPTLKSKQSALPTPQQGNTESRPAASSVQQTRIPPPRPSREGTPKLENSRAMPIIQSNLSHLATTGHKRRESVEKATAPSSTESLSMTRTSSLQTNASRLPSRLPITPDIIRSNNNSSLSLSSMARSDAGSNRVDLAQGDVPRRIPTPVSASPSKAGGRFGLFSKKPKSATEPTGPPVSERLPRKGPAAGTGHEGYGKYARRGRSGSTGTAASRTRSTSTDRSSVSLVRPGPGNRKGSFTSTDGKSDLDDFYRDRLEPVVIGGGGRIRENRNSGTSLYRTPSGQSSVTSVNSVSYPATAGSSARVSLVDSQPAVRSLLPAPNIEGLTAESERYQQPTLAHRRSMHRSQLLGDAQAPKIPPPINTRATAPSPVLETYDSTLSSVPRTGTSQWTDDLSEGHEGAWLRPKRKTPEKGALSRKWNFFRRPSHSPEPTTAERNNSFGNGSESSVAASQLQDQPKVAHYALMDDVEQGEEEDLDSRLREIESNLDLEEEDMADPFVTPSQHREPSMLLPSPPSYPAEFNAPDRAQSPRVMLNFDALPQLPPSKNSSRLPQVGRIPRVPSRRERDRAHNPSPQSFSRPFVPRTSLDETISTTSSTLVERPILAVETEPLKQTSWTPQSAKPASAPAINAMLYNLDGEKEFIHFSPSHVSVASGSGSSGNLSLAPIAAVAPPPDGALSEDDVWNEYDELLDRVVSPATFGTGSPDGLQSPQSFQHLDGALPAMSMPQQVQPLISHERQDSEPHQPLQIIRDAVPDQNDSLRAPALPKALASPISLSTVYAEYGSRASREKSPVRQSVSSTVSGSVYSSQTMVSRSGSRSSANSLMPERITKAMADKVSKTPDETLRFSALMTSRWLSFDRVLFSPVQEEIRANRQDRVLVVDGLENDDWSCYCALTYPDATFYNLSAAPVASWLGAGAANNKNPHWNPPTNHRRISHASIFAPFPFPKGFFTAAVVRFPAAHPLSAYRNLVSECKRVLRPGGYLELSVLDMDLVNAGPRARRAVRGLKTRMQTHSPDTSLNPVSDTLTRLLGRRGFENLNSCVVGVPVAGVLSDSRANSDEGRSTTSSGGERRGSTAGEAGAGGGGRASARPTLSMLLAGQTAAAPQPHYPMARMVARVGRWWWARCYEAGARAHGEASVWADPQLLAECEECETGLRLMVLYAQKPVSQRRRTVSV